MLVRYGEGIALVSAAGTAAARARLLKSAANGTAAAAAGRRSFQARAVALGRPTPWQAAERVAVWTSVGVCHCRRRRRLVQRAAPSRIVLAQRRSAAARNLIARRASRRRLPQSSRGGSDRRALACRRVRVRAREQAMRRGCRRRLQAGRMCAVQGHSTVLSLLVRTLTQVNCSRQPSTWAFRSRVASVNYRAGWRTQWLSPGGRRRRNRRDAYIPARAAAAPSWTQRRLGC